MSPVEKAIWITVLVACWTGGLAFAMWYARRWKARRDAPVIPASPVDFVPGDPYDDLPHVWTFPNGYRVYTNLPITEKTPQKVEFANGVTLTSLGNMSNVRVKNDYGLVMMREPSDDLFISLGSSSFSDSQIDIG